VNGGVLTASQLALLRAVQDRLVPPEGDLPGAGEAGGAERVDGHLAARPALRPALLAALGEIEAEAERLLDQAPPTSAGTRGNEEASGRAPLPDGAEQGPLFLSLSPEGRDAVLRAVETARPAPFRVLLRQTYIAYYTHPAVLAAVGYPSPAPQPAGFPLAGFDESLLARVRQRGKRWRDA
jgi:hypothetical protein